MNHTSAASFTRSIAKKEMQPISAKPVSTITMSFKAEGFFILSAAKSSTMAATVSTTGQMFIALPAIKPVSDVSR